MTDDGVGGDNPIGSADMALRWIKSNWTILAFLGGIGVYMVQTDRDTKNDFASIRSDIAGVKETAGVRSQVADEFYRKFADQNLANRVTNIETQMANFMRLMERSQEIQQQSTDKLQTAVNAVSVQVSVVSSKVDDLRNNTPRKTNLLMRECAFCPTEYNELVMPVFNR